MKLSKLRDHGGAVPAVSSSRICAAVSEIAAAVAAPGSFTVSVTGRDRVLLVEALAQTPDPRARRGVRYPFAVLLAVAVCAVMAGALVRGGRGLGRGPASPAALAAGPDRCGARPGDVLAGPDPRGRRRVATGARGVAAAGAGGGRQGAARHSQRARPW